MGTLPIFASSVEMPRRFIPPAPRSESQIGNPQTLAPRCGGGYNICSSGHTHRRGE